jgi:PAS domain S-box-containing protein
MTRSESGWLAEGRDLAPADHLFRAHFDALPAAAYIWKRTADDDLRLIAHNRAARLIANGDVAGILGMTASEVLKDHPDLHRALRRCADEQTTIIQEQDVAFVSGVTRRMHITRVPLSEDVVVVHMEDVTERRRAEAAVGASERRFRALFQSHPDLVFRMDVGGTYLDMHVPEGATLPAPPQDLIGRNIADVFGAEAAAQHWHYARKAVQTEEVQTIEYDVRVSGQNRHVESRLVSCGGNEVVVNIRDITERVELEQALTDARERERTRLGITLEQQLIELRGCSERLGAALSPTYAASESRAVDVDVALEAFQGALRAAEEVARDLAPVRDGTPLHPALIDLARHMEQLHGITCRLSHSDAVPAMVTQAPDLYRIAQEAITNAVEHGQATAVDVICGVVGDQFVLNVADNGTGFRLGAVDRAGVGMRIMSHRARRLGGNLTRSRRAGGGTLVTCTCPVAGVLRSARGSGLRDGVGTQ